MSTHIETVKVTTAGSDGVAAGSESSEALYGVLEAIYINYTSQPSTTDIVITYTFNGITETILTVTSANTDVVIRLALPMVDASNSASTVMETKPYLPGVAVTVTVAQGDAEANGVVVQLVTSN